MRLIKNILILRFKQFFRLIMQVGPGLILLMLFLVSGVTLKFFQNILEFPPEYSLIFSLLLLLSIDFQRKDLAFLLQIFDTKTQMLLLLFFEYLLIVFPIIIFQLIWGIPSVGGLLFLVPIIPTFLSGIIKKPLNDSVKQSIPLIPLQNFEIRFQVEKRKWIYLVVFILGHLSYFHIAFFIVSIFLIALLILEAFNSNEPSEMIDWSPNFVLKKMKKNIQLVLSAYFLAIVQSLLFYSELKWLILYSVVFLMVMISMAICYKYSTYTPLYHYEKSSNVLGVMIVFSLLPGGILISIGFSIFHYFKAESKMKTLYA